MLVSRKVTGVHQLPASVSTALTDGRIDWTLLQMAAGNGAPAADAVILLRSTDVAAFGDLVRAAGFVELPGARGSSRCYAALERAAARFLSLRVTSRIDLGRNGEFRTAFAAGVLERSVRTPEGFVPSPEDGFWLLLLRCLLEDGGILPEHRGSLLAGVRGARVDSEIPRVLDGVLRPAGIGAVALRTWAATEEWAELARAAEPLRNGWHRVSPPRRWPSRRDFGRERRGNRLSPGRRGLSVAVLGPDGAGKSTLAEGIEHTFPVPVVKVYMGLWKSGDDARTVAQLREIAARPFRAWFRFASAKAHQFRGRLVVFDRYVYDARLPPSPPAVTAKRIYFWFLSRACPPPDLALLLDLPGAVSYARKGENSAEENEAARQGFLALRDELRLHVLDATRSSEEVLGDALEVIWAACLARWGESATADLAAPSERVVPAR